MAKTVWQFCTLVLHKSSEQIINSSIPLTLCNNYMQNNVLTADIIEDHEYFPDICRITEFSSRIIVHIAGFMVK